MGKRVLTAAVGAPLLLLLAWGGGWWLGLAATGLAWLGAREYLALGQAMGRRPLGAVLVAGAGWLVLSAAAGAASWRLLPPAMLAVLTWLGRHPRHAVPDLTLTVCGIYYLGLLAYLPLLRQQGWEALLLAFLAVWLGDTGAFFAGRAAGRHRLAPSLSPAKTVEGAVAGLAASLLAGLAWAAWQGAPPAASAAVAGLAGAAGQAGDLLESGWKREAGVKDAGALLPGHGGVLDRFDSLLLAAPVVYHLWGPLIIGR